MNGMFVLVLIVLLLALFVRQWSSGERVEDIQAALKKGGRIIDVRTPDEYRAGHLPQALNLPLAELQERLVQEIPDKETPLLLHCASGARSAAGKRVAVGLGYRTVLNIGSYARAASISQTK